jgi:hypothetical protein
MKRAFIIVIALAAAGFLLWYGAPSKDVTSSAPPSVAAPARQNMPVQIGNATVAAEVADTSAEQMQGLSGRASLGADAGMLFTFDAPTRTGFWMNGMRFPLDLIYMKDHAVVDLKENEPVPTVLPTPFFASTDFDAVLEVNAGWAATHHVVVGMGAQY